jgi:hypothetical protein
MSLFDFIDKYDNEILFESCDSGLGDRMMSIIGFCVLCEIINAIPIINFNYIKSVCVWGSNVYDFSNFVFDINHYDAKTKYYRKIANHTSIVLSPLKLYKTIKHIININYIDFSNKYRIIASKIKPSAQVESYIPNLKDVYGIHLRRTDKVCLTPEYEHENTVDEFNCIINNLIDDLVELLKNNNNAKLLIVGEDKKWNNEFKNILNCKYGKNINYVNIVYPEIEINDGFNCILDLFCLSRCKQIYQGVKWSTFSSLAALIGNVDIINYYNILPDHESNFVHTWKSTLKINGNFDYTEYENIGNRLGDIKIKHINTNNMFF